MLRASRVEVLLTATDLLEALVGHATGKAEIVGLELGDGFALLRIKATAERLPMAVPVDLRLTVRSVRETVVELGVEWSNMPLLPGFLKEIALQKAFEALPGKYENGLFVVDSTEVLEDMPVQFRIESVAVGPEAIRAVVTDVAVFPLQTAALLEAPVTAVVPVASGEEAKLEEHQDFYHKLRANMTRWADRKAPRWMQPLLPWVLAVPDFFVLMVRLARDPRVPAIVKVMTGAVIAYIITPIDLLPDALPLVGQVDDVAVALFALEQIATRVPGEVVQELWPGEGQVLDLVREGVDLFKKVLPGKMLDAIRAVISRK